VTQAGTQNPNIDAIGDGIRYQIKDGAVGKRKPASLAIAISRASI